MRNVYSCLIILFSFAACAQKENEKTEIKEVKLYYPNGKPKILGYELNGKKTGTSKTYYENGTQKTENHWENDIQIGSTKKWFSNGNIDYIGQIKNGDEDGEWKYYDDLSRDYIYSVLYKNGEVDSFWFTDAKYRWRKHTFTQQRFSLDLPSYISDSANLADGVPSYWVMFPWSKKSEIEYYSIYSVPTPYNEDSLICIIKTLPQKDLLSSIARSNNETSDETIPDISVDKVFIESENEVKINQKKCIKVIAKFPDLNLKLYSVLFISNNNLCVVSCYQNEKMEQSTIERFLNSVSVY